MSSIPTAPPPSSPREPFLASALSHPGSTEAREHLLAWAAGVAARLRELGHEGAANDLAAADDEVRVVLLRALAGDERRACIALSVTREHVEVAVEVPPGGGVDALRARLAHPARARETARSLQALPEQFTLGAGRDAEPAPVSQASVDGLRALLAQVEHEPQTLHLGWRIAREVARVHAALLEEQLADAAVALGSVFALFAPPPPEPAAVKAAARQPRGQTHSRGQARPAPTEPADSKAHARASTRAPARPRDGRKQALGRSTVHPPPLEKGARVRVLEGPFCGKVGFVHELDGKGGARVMLGLLAVRVDLRDLARCTEGRDRPVLSTSHRKPLPVRS